ncbi:MAG TPA: hypothetical protein VJI98_00550 [Candidatus Nanoarchaeia archaeon]|nr:hypothetical protein [Candidatus Nanoarchaeia archaeon]
MKKIFKEKFWLLVIIPLAFLILILLDDSSNTLTGASAVEFEESLVIEQINTDINGDQLVSDLNNTFSETVNS